ncbi:MAG: hypothetical protein A2086_17140 [Spirochaetes bacterium GWD1_27_9]|nr:MAG: hypothetical protein A2Z98_02600 [Spirochaetes bacterium GWB1_27_13]OHD27310.1 MAG: hypothetical protein A2Y34_15925 [Spirochaetes bacterium GWC1_27_15]OHD34172.1 MAG: hypothetical protein A2086_17140 [Spirochaetes bacterium GWD1_27_9]
MSKKLVTYFSRKGNNYVGGNIVNLPVRNTEVIAKKIQKIIECDLFQIETVKSYPEDYTETTNIAKDELNKNLRPDLKKLINNFELIINNLN